MSILRVLVVVSLLIGPCACWTQLDYGGVVPVERRGHSAILWRQSALVVFGGRTSILNGNTTTEQWLNDVAIFNISTNNWQSYEADPAGAGNPVSWPAVRYQHSAVITSDVMIIYGGYSQVCQDYCDDTWEYNILPATDASGRGLWQQINVTTSPGKRWWHTATMYDGSMFIFGGHRLDEYLNDVWRYDLTIPRRWTLVEPTGHVAPIGRLGHAAAVDPTIQSWYIYGGWNGNGLGDKLTDPTHQAYYLSDLWTFNLNTSTWDLVVQPADATEFPPAAFGAKLQVSAPIVFLFNGYASNEYSGSVWRYNSSSLYWTLHQIYNGDSSSVPAPRAESAVIYFAEYELFLLFAGWGSTSAGGNTVVESYYNDLWVFDLNFCPDGCNGRGYCFFGYCFCNEDWFGTDCQSAYCATTQCEYSLATQRQICEHCNGNGECLYGDCVCDIGWATNGTTADAESFACIDAYCVQNCNGHGQCALSSSGDYACVCDAPFYGAECDIAYCTSDCNTPYGQCNTATGQCDCAVTPLGQFTGTNCITFVSN